MGPEGQKAQSRLHAWRVHEASRTNEEPSGSEEVEADSQVQTRAPTCEVADLPTPPPRPQVMPPSVRKSLAERLSERGDLSSWLRGRFSTNEGSPNQDADADAVEEPDVDGGATSQAMTRPERSKAAKDKPNRFVSWE